MYPGSYPILRSEKYSIKYRIIDIRLYQSGSSLHEGARLQGGGEITVTLRLHEL